MTGRLMEGNRGGVEEWVFHMCHTGTVSDDDEFEEEELVVMVGWQRVEDRMRM